MEDEQLFLLLGFYTVLGRILYRGSFPRFSPPSGFPKINLCVLLCGCACLCFNDLFAHGYVVMMLNIIRSYITIKT